MFKGGLVYALQAHDNVLVGSFGGCFSIAIPCIYLILVALYQKDNAWTNLLRLTCHLVWMSK